MDKIKELLIILNTITSSNMLSTNLAASDLNSVEWDDEEIQKIKDQVSGLMTKEAAAANPEVQAQLKENRKFIESVIEKEKPQITSGILESVKNEHLIPLAVKLGVDVGDGDKLADVAEKIKTVDINAVDPQQEELIKKIKQERAEALQKVLETENHYKQELEAKDALFARKELMDNVKKFAESKNWLEYIGEDVRNSIIETKLKNIESRAKLELVEGEIVVKDKDTGDDIFLNGKDRATFDSLFSPEIDEYLEKSNGKKEPAKRFEQKAADPQLEEASNYFRQVGR